MALTRERVVSAAVEILRQFGLADLSMRRLARELDVQPGAIYWHVPNKQALLAEVADQLLADVHLPEAGAGSASDLRTLVTGIHQRLLPVPDAADVVEVAYALDADAIPALSAIRAQVQGLAASKKTAKVDAAVDLLVHHILGSVAAHQVRAHADGPMPQRPSLEDAVDVVIRGLG